MTHVRRVALAAVLVAAALAVIALSALAVWSTRPVSDADLERAAAMAAADADAPLLRAAAADCVDRPEAYGIAGSGSAAADCARAVAPDPAFYLGRPPLDASAVAAYDVVLLGLALTALAAAAGLVLDGVPGWTLPRALAASSATGAGLGLLGAAALWAVVTVTLARRGLEPPHADVLLQIGRAGLLTAAACLTAAVATRRLRSAAWAVLVLGGAAMLTFWLPVDVLDVGEAWLTWDAL